MFNRVILNKEIEFSKELEAMKAEPTEEEELEHDVHAYSGFSSFADAWNSATNKEE